VSRTSYRASTLGNETVTMGLVDERGKELDHRHLVQPAVGARGDEWGERGASPVHRDMMEQGLLVHMEEVVAPLDERPERATARIRGRPLAEELQAVRDEGVELREARAR
jgi:hypothetical protein